ncbi:MAG: GNAT family N-acetyltransferase [Archangium sp.]
MALHVRPATRADVPLIFRLICDLAEYERARDEVKTNVEALTEQLFGAHPGAEAVIGEIDGTPRGFALFFHNFSTWHGKRGLYLEDLYVEPASRGSGLGKALLVHLAKIAVERKCARFEWSVLDWNEPALKFYAALGAKPMTEWTVHRVDGEALLRLAQT